jgi:hypothetical protein
MTVAPEKAADFLSSCLIAHVAASAGYPEPESDRLSVTHFRHIAFESRFGKRFIGKNFLIPVDKHGKMPYSTKCPAKMIP